MAGEFVIWLCFLLIIVSLVTVLLLKAVINDSMKYDRTYLWVQRQYTDQELNVTKNSQH